jgi:hypothetical protein
MITAKCEQINEKTVNIITEDVEVRVCWSEEPMCIAVTLPEKMKINPNKYLYEIVIPFKELSKEMKKYKD